MAPTSGPMSGELFVQPTELRAAVTEVAAAADALAGARAALTAAEAAAREALGADGRAEHKLHTFVRQYDLEYELIAESLVAFRDVLEGSAAGYDELEAAMVEGLRGSNRGSR